MHCFSLVALHRSLSIGLCRQLTSAYVFGKRCNGLTPSKYSHVRHFNVTAIPLNAVINQVQNTEFKVPNKKDKKNKRSSVESSEVLLVGTISGAQEVTSTARTTNDSNKTLNQLRKHITRFFAKYPPFTYDPTKPYTEEFLRMTREFGWSEDSEEYKFARKKLNTASVLQFNENFDEEDESKNKLKSKKKDSRNEKQRKMLRKWIRLFDRIDIKDAVMPKTVPEFEERVESVHTNICDVLDADVIGNKSIDWENEVTLSQYTRSTKKFFPRDHPLAGTLLKHLFRHILDPSATRGFEKKSKIQKN
ncbi:hypothetical protein RSOL_120690 [Rhizoctonia solani AG-3 Rhs1AP]|uniref:Uncharacterized protein n=2 Tax=Rhizoctonia solani AG-3 TaxID=1086053 RepID=A0A074SMZ4_9AGAM|nr:hypothetical protein RSOL_120690 [Rhizoctonia solani AG-3 Rhs1AP]KEP51417.1 hypothetical protein V565_062170 [Rhizoctonia solani 123E]